MKILQVIPFFTPARGGSVMVPYYLSKELSKRGHKVTIITTDFEFDREYAKSIKKEGVEVIPFHCIANIKLFLISPNMKKWLKTNIKDFDVIHMHNFRSYQNAVAHHYAKKHGIPYILQARGSIPRIIEKQRLKKLYDWVWGNKILRDASKVIALTEAEAEQYKKMDVDENKIEIVPNGIDLSEYENLPKRGEFRRKYKIKDNEKIILSLGRIHKIKGIDLLVRAFADLTKTSDNIKLVIVGPDDGFLSNLKKQIKDLKIEDRILITGPLYGENKLKAFVDADVYVLPSFYETFSNTVLEAWACGTPVILTDRCGITDYAKKIGCVVEYDKDKLKHAITKILTDEGLRRKIGKEGIRVVREKFGWDRIFEQLENIYKSYLPSKTSS